MFINNVGFTFIMRSGQGMPVNMIVLTALALLVLVVVGAFFISGFGQASGSVNVVNATQADCQSICQSLAAAAYNYNSCSALEANPQATSYATKCAESFGACTVTISGGVSCSCSVDDGAAVCSKV